jgi:ribulose bisphosphate carboxylase small subunit
MTVKVIGPGQRRDGALDVTSRSTNWGKELSPFYLGPCTTPEGIVASNVENLWQFSKVYAEFVDSEKNPTALWREWSRHGMKLKRAVRYPAGKGAIPLFSFWKNQKLDYIEARKQIYLPYYRDAVKKTRAWKLLKSHYEDKREIVLFDFDGHGDTRTLKQVLNDPNKKMGHGYVLAMMLLYGEDFNPGDLA